MIAQTPPAPYYAVIFTTIRTEGDNGYEAMAYRMDELAKTQPGYLGAESARNETGITVSYWRTLNDIAQWRMNSEHLAAQKSGIKEWYKAYKLRICLVQRDYDFYKI